MAGTCATIWHHTHKEGQWALHLTEHSDLYIFFWSFTEYLVELSALVPISLAVCLELVKFGHAYFIHNDLKMCSIEHGAACALPHPPPALPPAPCLLPRPATQPLRQDLCLAFCSPAPVCFRPSATVVSHAHVPLPLLAIFLTPACCTHGGECCLYICAPPCLTCGRNSAQIGFCVLAVHPNPFGATMLVWNTHP